VKVHLRDADCLVLESNHDLDMLKVGPYPWVVKQRVLSRTGHLSNHAVSEFLADPDGFDARARFLVLAHLSLENNNPDLAQISAEEALNRRPAESVFGGQLSGRIATSSSRANSTLVSLLSVFRSHWQQLQASTYFGLA